MIESIIICLTLVWTHVGFKLELRFGNASETKYSRRATKCVNALGSLSCLALLFVLLVKGELNLFSTQLTYKTESFVSIGT